MFNKRFSGNNDKQISCFLLTLGNSVVGSKYSLSAEFKLADEK
jgi:hypothetical protein